MTPYDSGQPGGSRAILPAHPPTSKVAGLNLQKIVETIVGHSFSLQEPSGCEEIVGTEINQKCPAMFQKEDSKGA